MTWIKPFIAVLILVLFAAAVYWIVWTPNQTIAAIQVQSSKGQKIQLGGRDGKPMLINFWASSCKSCMEEIPYLIDIYQTWQAAGFEIIGVTMSYDPPIKAMEKAQQKNITYPIVFDLDKKIQKHFGLRSAVTPVTILIGHEGRISYQRIGKPDFVDLREQIKNLMSPSIKQAVRSTDALG